MRLFEFYDMPYCEFQLKAFAFDRMQKEKMRHTRFLAFHSLIGSHADPKKLPKDLAKFMPIDEEKRTEPMSDEAIALYREEMRKYKEAVEREKITLKN